MPTFLRIPPSQPHLHSLNIFPWSPQASIKRPTPTCKKHYTSPHHQRLPRPGEACSSLKGEMCQLLPMACSAWRRKILRTSASCYASLTPQSGRVSCRYVLAHKPYADLAPAPGAPDPHSTQDALPFLLLAGFLGFGMGWSKKPGPGQGRSLEILSLPFCCACKLRVTGAEEPRPGTRPTPGPRSGHTGPVVFYKKKERTWICL